MLSKFAFILTLFLVVSGFSQDAHDKYTKITPEIQEKIKNALPKDFPKATKPKKIVVFSKSLGFVHASTSVGIEMLKQ